MKIFRPLAANDAARGSTLEETQLTSPLHRFIYSMPYFHCFICCIYGTVRIYGLHSIEKDISDYLMSRGAVREEITYAILDCVTKGLVAQVFHAVSIIRLTTYLYKARKKDQKLKRKTEEFMRFVFHEIRVPFNSLILSLSVVKDAVEPLLRLRSSEADSGDKSNTDNDNILEHLEIAQISSQGMMRVVNDVLTLQKMQAGLVIIRPEPTDLIHVVRNVIRIHSYEAQKKDIDIVFETSEKLSTMLLVDGKRMHQIISNLVSNAVKFAEKRIVICLDVMGKGSEGGKRTVVLKVKDDGVGISKEDQEMLFQQFSQIRAKEQQNLGGNGMGLWICRQLAQLFEGSITVFSMGEGQGASFRLEFPATFPTEQQILDSKQKKNDADEDILSLRSAETTSAETKKKRIQSCPSPKKAEQRKSFEEYHALVVDDVKSTRLLVGRVLEKLKLSVELADDGVTALAAYEKRKPDIIFMDNTMPRMSGVEATRILRERGSTVPILGVTGNSLEDDCKLFLEAGADVVFVKPITPGVIAKSCEEWLLSKPK